MNIKEKLKLLKEKIIKDTYSFLTSRKYLDMNIDEMYSNMWLFYDMDKEKVIMASTLDAMLLDDNPRMIELGEIDFSILINLLATKPLYTTIETVINEFKAKAARNVMDNIYSKLNDAEEKILLYLAKKEMSYDRN